MAVSAAVAACETIAEFGSPKEQRSATIHDLDTQDLRLALDAVNRMQMLWPAEQIARMRADIGKQIRLQRMSRSSAADS